MTSNFAREIVATHTDLINDNVPYSAETRATVEACLSEAQVFLEAALQAALNDPAEAEDDISVANRTLSDLFGDVMRMRLAWAAKSEAK